MSNQSLAKLGLKKALVESLYNEIVSNTNNYYYFVGKPREWDNGPTAVIPPTLAISSESDTRRDMVLLKKITAADASFTIPRYDWTSGLVYDAYDDRTGAIFDLVASPVAAGSQQLVFKTKDLSSTGTLISYNNPLLTSFSVEEIMQQFGEGWLVTGTDSPAAAALVGQPGYVSDNPIPLGGSEIFVKSASYTTTDTEATITVELDGSISKAVNASNGSLLSSSPTNNTIRFTCLSENGANSLKTARFFVVTPDRNVYKCIYNNNGAPSTIMPYSTSQDLITTSDGYIWKFMYTIPVALMTKFMTDTDIPVSTSIRSPYYSGGAITTATVLYYGSGYSYPASPSTLNVRGDGYLADNPYKINSIDIVDPGFGYTVPPIINIAPPYVCDTWVANTQYGAGVKLLARNTDIYEVVTPGYTGSTAPTHTSISPAINGTTTMRFVGKQVTAQAGDLTQLLVTGLSTGNLINATKTNGDPHGLVVNQLVQFTETYTTFVAQTVTTAIINNGSQILVSGTHSFVKDQPITFSASYSPSGVAQIKVGQVYYVELVVVSNVTDYTKFRLRETPSTQTGSVTMTLTQGTYVTTIVTGVWQTPIVANTAYYVLSSGLSSAQFRVSSTRGGTQVTLPTPKGRKTISQNSIDTVYNTFTSTSHGFSVNQIVKYYANSGTPISTGGSTYLVNGQDYYIINPTTNTFQLSNSLGGAAIDIQSTGNNAQYLEWTPNPGFGGGAYSYSGLTPPSTQGNNFTTVPKFAITSASDIIQCKASDGTTDVTSWLQAGQKIVFNVPFGSITAGTPYFISPTSLQTFPGQFKLRASADATTDVTIGASTSFTIIDTPTVYSSMNNYVAQQTIGYVVLSNPGRGYSQTSPPVVTIASTLAGDPGTGAAVTAEVSADGYINRLVITNRGSNYFSTPEVTIAPPNANLQQFDGASSLYVDLTNDTITFPDSSGQNLGIGFYTGARVLYIKNGGAAIATVGGLISGRTYYAIAVGPRSIKLTNSYSDAMKGINIVNLTALGGGTSNNHAIQLDVLQAQGFVQPYAGYGYTAAPTIIVADPITAYNVAWSADSSGFSSQTVAANQIVMSGIDSLQKNFYKVIPTVYNIITSNINNNTTSYAISPTSDVDIFNNIITIPNHNLSPGQPIVYNSNTGTAMAYGSSNTAMTDGSIWYAIPLSSSTFNIASTFANATASTPVPLDISNAGNILQTFSITENTLTVAYHGLTSGQAITYQNGGGTALSYIPPAGTSTSLTNGTTYYAIPLTNNTFKLADTAANATAKISMNLNNTGNNSQTFTVTTPKMYAKPTWTNGAVDRTGTATLVSIARTATMSISGAKTKAILMPLIDNGSIVGVSVQEPGIGYTSATITAVGSTTQLTSNPITYDDAIIVADLSIGDVGSRQANTELLAVPGTIDDIVVLHKGNNYASAIVTITGDGTGATAEAVITNGQITKINVLTRGTGYSRATIIISGVALQSGTGIEKAFARAVISPLRGHGSNAVAELFATDVTLTSSIATDKNQGFYVGSNNEYRQFGILKNPTLLDSTLRFTKDVGSPCYTITLKLSTTFDQLARDMILIESNNQKPAYRYVIVDFDQITADTVHILVQAIDNTAAYVGQSLKGLIGTTYATIGTVTNVRYPDLDKYSGEVLFIDNRASFQTSADSVAVVKTTLRL